MTAFIMVVLTGTCNVQAAIEINDIDPSSETLQDSDNADEPSSENENITDKDQPDEETKVEPIKKSARGAFAVLVFKFLNLTGDKENNEACIKIARYLTQGLSKNKKLYPIDTGIHLTAFKTKQFTEYLENFKLNLDTNVIDFMIGGQIRKNGTENIIECFLFITRLKQIKKISIRWDPSEQSLRMITDNLAKTTSIEIDNQIRKIKRRSPRRNASMDNDAYISLGVYYGFWFVLEGNKNGFPKTYAGMLTILISWEFAKIMSLRFVEKAKGHALFLSVDIGESAANLNVLDKGSSIYGEKYHFGLWGITVGPMYKFFVYDFFIIDIAAGYGPVYSQTALWSDYNGAANLIIPPRYINASWNHYLNALITFNGIVYPNCMITTAYSYKLIIYPRQYLHSLVAKIGLTIKF